MIFSSEMLRDELKFFKMTKINQDLGGKVIVGNFDFGERTEPKLATLPQMY